MRLLISFLLFVSLFAAFGQEKKAGPKNLQLIQPSDVRPMMAAFRAGLGVQCTYCHVQGDFASDDNPKKTTARHMISMTKEINAKFPDGKEHVTCFTCHRGAEEPLTAAPAQ